MTLRELGALLGALILATLLVALVLIYRPTGLFGKATA